MSVPMTELMSENHAILDTISPVSSAVAVNGTWVSASGFRRFCAKLNVGLIAATGTLDFKVEQATTSGGAGAKTVKAITQLAEASDNVQRWIEFKAEDLDVDGGFKWLRIVVTPATAASLVSAELLGFNAAYTSVTQPASLVVVQA